MSPVSTEPSPSSDREPHLLRQVAESFGVDADRYDRARPRYPDALIQRVIAASPGVEFLDVNDEGKARLKHLCRKRKD